jgi:hypothetical protein
LQGLVLEAEQSGPLHDGPTSKAGQSGCCQRVSQHESGVVDGPASEARLFAAMQRASNSYEVSTIEEFKDFDKLVYGFRSVDPLEEIDIGDDKTPRPSFVNKTLEADPRDKMIDLLKEYSYCFAWSFTKMLGSSREIMEHQLPIKSDFRPFKQRPRSFRLDLLPRIKDEIHQLLEANFIRPCKYAEWVSNIVPMEKKESGKLRVCIDFRNLNRAYPKEEYPIPIADMLINNALGSRVISFLDGNARYNQIFMVEEDESKTIFICRGIIGLFDWVIMTFGLKNADATYQRAMNLMFHELLGNTMEVFDKMCRYDLQMN